MPSCSREPSRPEPARPQATDGRHRTAKGGLLVLIRGRCAFSARLLGGADEGEGATRLSLRR